MENKKIRNINDFKRRKESGEQISVITCYDYTMATLVDKSNVDAILVGDSLGMVSSGYESTVPVTVDEMIYHTKAVRKGSPDAFIITDMPFLSYHISDEEAVANGGKILKESGANGVKIEGGVEFLPTIKKVLRASIPVMGHLGLTPQSVHAFGGFKVQGRDKEAAEKMISDAKALEDAGIFALVLELVPENLAKEIAESLSIPVIGIGAGRYCDGQVLVINDMLGMDESNRKFLKKYADLSTTIRDALNSYDSEVKSRVFPAEENSFK